MGRLPPAPCYWTCGRCLLANHNVAPNPVRKVCPSVPLLAAFGAHCLWPFQVAMQVRLNGLQTLFNQRLNGFERRMFGCA